MRITLRVLQVFLGLLLLTTSVGKLLDIPGFAEVLLTYHLFPKTSLLPIAWSLPLFELLISLWILSGIQLKYSALAAILLHLQFTTVAVISNLRGLDIPNCGCVGVFWPRPLSWVTVVEDLMATAACATRLLRRF